LDVDFAYKGAGTIGTLGCPSATAETIVSCASVAANQTWIGIIQSTIGGSQAVQTVGDISAVFDASINATAGDIVCTSTITAGDVFDSVAVPCPNVQSYVGRVKYQVTASTAAAVIVLDHNPQVVNTQYLTNVTAVTDANPTAATDTILMAIALPANFFITVGQPYKIYGAGVLTTTAASLPLVTITAKLCSVAGCGSGTVTPLAAIQSAALSTTAIANSTWSYNLTATVTAVGASCALVVKGDPGLTIETGASVATADSVYADSNTAASSPTQNCANALFLDFFVQQSTTGASNSYKQLVGMIR
jgi:hypothetical protein